jgi:prepilin-type N-terminal cleavage/methylation domain-containing protein/prepilin-type processing-associated H-X9-DG protein
MIKQKAFTLIELLVAVSIIALLIGILLPALGRARETARDTQCKVRVSQVFLAQTMYAHDHGQYTTIWNKEDGSYSEEGPEPAKTNLENYLTLSRKTLESADSVLQCPSVSDEELLSFYDFRFYGSRPSSIGINSAMHFDRWGFVPERVPNTSGIIVIAEQAVEPSEQVLTADGVGARKTGAVAYWNRVAKHKPQRGYRHGGTPGSNVAMADGHVEHLAHEHLNHKSGYWFWWNASTDPAASTSEEQGCGCQ